jgi:hypothetical protein
MFLYPIKIPPKETMITGTVSISQFRKKKIIHKKMPRKMDIMTKTPTRNPLSMIIALLLPSTDNKVNSTTDQLVH